MDSIAFARSKPGDWLARSVLAPHVDAFKARLRQGQYTVHIERGYTAAIAHLARWMMQRCLPLSHLDERSIELFVGQHLPHCDCPPPIVRDRKSVSAACGHLLAVLRERRAIAWPAIATGPIEEELRRYDAHLRDARGLTEGTRRGQLHSVRRLLLYKFADGPVQIAQLQPEELREFINQQLELRATASHAAALTSALRMYLRYRATRGDQVHALIGVIASPVQWRLATLPRALTRAQVDISVIALWLGHESPTNTHHYVEADLAMKDRALAKIQSPNARVRRYHAPDNLLQFLQTL